MVYDFDTVISRRETDSVKWAVGENELPMWVADMDFRTAPEILSALRERLDHGIFGYGDVPDAWSRAYRDWWRERHGLDLRPEWLGFCTGVVPAISSMIRAFTSPGEAVLIQPPVYNAFWHCIEQGGRAVSESPLLWNGTDYRMDLADLERKMSDPRTRLMILCNPQNPTGNLWDAETLRAVGEMALRLGVTVISDEIHCDITLPGRSYTPFASASETCGNVSVTCLAPTKTFNLAGLQTAAVFAPDDGLRRRVFDALRSDGLSSPNSFACEAAAAAFTGGGPWLDELRSYLAGNRSAVDRFLRTELPCIRLVPGEATYLLWLDISALSCSSREFAAFLRRETGLFLIPGAAYGREGDRFLRLNAACPRTTLNDGLERLRRGAESWLSGKGGSEA